MIEEPFHVKQGSHVSDCQITLPYKQNHSKSLPSRNFSINDDSAGHALVAESLTHSAVMCSRA